MYIVTLTTNGFLGINGNFGYEFQGSVNQCKKFLEDKLAEYEQQSDFGARFLEPNKMVLEIYQKPSFIPTGEKYEILSAF